MPQQFKLELKSGPDAIRKFTENTTETFAAGEMVALSGTATAADIVAVTGSVSTGVLGVAAVKGHNAAAKVRNEGEVYVVSPDQLWEIHVDTNVKPNTAYTLGENYKVDQITDTSFTITREAETASTTINIKGPILRTTAATTDGRGLVLVGYADEATRGKKGQKVIVRFAPGACQTHKSTST